MSLKGIIENVFKLGIIQTYELGKENARKKIVQENIERKITEKREDIDFVRRLREMLSETTDERDKKEILSEISKAERYLRAKYIKEILPDEYNKESQYPVENKVVIMERGGALSINFKCLIAYIKENTELEIDIHILKLGVVELEDYFLNAKEYVRSIARAKAVFVCTANDLAGHFTVRPETTYIQLWHACGAFKRFGLSTIDKKFGKSAKSHKMYPVNTNYDYVTIASPDTSWIYEEAMNIEKDSGIIIATGISRTDVFFDEDYISRCYKKIHEKIPASKDKKVILYAPTFRGEVAKSSSPSELNIKQFAETLGDEYVLVIKHHQAARVIPPIPEEYENSFAYDMTRGKGMDINELMTVSDICISDYSSLVFEYSLFERPMVFFAFDLEDYIDYRGLYYDYEEITPGPVFKTNEEIIEYILQIDKNFDKQIVVDFKNKFMSSCDGHATERIVALIK